MPNRGGNRQRTELLQGALDMLILQTLRCGPAHGYGIGHAIRIKSEWKNSEHNQRARYYQLTAAGKKQLNAEHSRWKQLSAAASHPSPFPRLARQLGLQRAVPEVAAGSLFRFSRGFAVFASRSARPAALFRGW